MKVSEKMFFFRISRKFSKTIKRGVIKGFGDRARALCYPQYLQNESKNIEEVFLEAVVSFLACPSTPMCNTQIHTLAAKQRC